MKYCIDCGAEISNSRKRCKSCAYKHDLALKRIVYNRRKESGMCVLCGAEKAVPGQTKCAKCEGKALQKAKPKSRELIKRSNQKTKEIEFLMIFEQYGLWRHDKLGKLIWK